MQTQIIEYIPKTEFDFYVLASQATEFEKYLEKYTAGVVVRRDDVLNMNGNMVSVVWYAIHFHNMQSYNHFVNCIYFAFSKALNAASKPTVWQTIKSFFIAI